MAADELDAPQNGSERVLSGSGPESGLALDSKNATREVLEAIHELYIEDYDECVSYARSRLGSTEAAQDVVQQAFTNTLNAVEKGAHISNISGFIRRCVHNLCVNRGYRECREPTLSLDESLHEISGNSTATSAELRDKWHEVESIVDKLAPNQRDAFLLTEIKGYSYEETANSMDLTIDSVRQLLNRARKTIRTRADTGLDSVGIPAPVLAADSTFKSWRPSLRSNISDWVQPKVSELQAWLGNVSQTGTDGLLHSGYTLAVGLAIVALGTASPAPSVQLDTVKATPIAGIVVDQRPVTSRPNTHSTGTQTGETAPGPIQIDYSVRKPIGTTPQISDVAEGKQHPDPLVTNRPPEAEKADLVDVPDGQQVPGPDQGEGLAADPVSDPGGSYRNPEDTQPPQDPCIVPNIQCFSVTDGGALSEGDAPQGSVSTVASGEQSDQESTEPPDGMNNREPVSPVSDPQGRPTAK